MGDKLFYSNPLYKADAPIDEKSKPEGQLLGEITVVDSFAVPESDAEWRWRRLQFNLPGT